MELADSQRTSGNMINKVIGFIGKAHITPSEKAKLVVLGDYIARMGRTLCISPAQGAASAVESGVIGAEGKVLRETTGILSKSDHTLVYADERLLNRLLEVNPRIKDDTKVSLISSELELDLWLKSVEGLLKIHESKQGMA